MNFSEPVGKTITRYDETAEFEHIAKEKLRKYSSRHGLKEIIVSRYLTNDYFGATQQTRYSVMMVKFEEDVLFVLFKKVSFCMVEI